LTKGDNNLRDDRYGIYHEDMEWLQKEHIIGRVKGIVPYVGMATIIMTDYPLLKYLILGVMAMLVLTQRD
jgi:signal peptidase